MLASLGDDWAGDHPFRLVVLGAGTDPKGRETVQVSLDGQLVGWLTPKMTARFLPGLQATIAKGRRLTACATLEPSKRKGCEDQIDLVLRVPRGWGVTEVSAQLPGLTATALTSGDVASGIAAFAGALGASVVAFYVGRSSHTREARARIVRETLPALHGAVNERMVQVQAGSQPLGQEGPIGPAYSELVRDATAASAADHRRVVGFQQVWDQIGITFSEYAMRRKVAQGAVLAAIEMDLHARQVEQWGRANDYLAAYQDWLTARLTSRWWP